LSLCHQLKFFFTAWWFPLGIFQIILFDLILICKDIDSMENQRLIFPFQNLEKSKLFWKDILIQLWKAQANMIWVFATNLNFLIPKFLLPDWINLKLKLFDLTKFLFWNIWGYAVLGWKEIRVCDKDSTNFSQHFSPFLLKTEN